MRDNTLRKHQMVPDFQPHQSPIEEPQVTVTVDYEAIEDRYEFYYFANLALFSLATILFSFILLSLEIGSIWSISIAISISLAVLQASRYIRSFLKKEQKTNN